IQPRGDGLSLIPGVEAHIRVFLHNAIKLRCSADLQTAVSQIWNLPGSNVFPPPENRPPAECKFGDTADCKSALHRPALWLRQTYQGMKVRQVEFVIFFTNFRIGRVNYWWKITYR